MNQDNYVGTLTDVLFTHAVSPTCLLDEKGAIVCANAAFTALVNGDTSETSRAISGEVVGSLFEEYLGGGLQPKAFARFIKSLPVGESAYFDSRLRSPDADCYRWQIQSHQDSDRVLTVVSGNKLDSVDSAFGKYSKRAYVLLDQGEIVDANHAFYHLIGLENPAEVVGSQVTSFASNGSRLKLSDIRDWKTGDLEITLQHKSGKLFPARALCRTAPYQGDRIRMLILEEKSDWEETMVSNVQVFQQAFEHSDIAMAIVATNGYIYELNSALAQLTGYDKGELIQTLAGDLMYKQDRAGLKSIGKRIMAGKRTHAAKDIRLKKKNKRLIWVRLTSTILRVSEEEQYFLVAFENIDRHKRHERQLEIKAEELEKANAELEHFAYVASHDLKEPLRTISAFLQLLKKRYQDKLDSDANEYIDYTIEATGRLHNLIRNLLEYSRTREFPDEKELVDLNELLEQVNGNLKEVSEARQANLMSEFLPSIKVNRMQMAQLFQNLIDNAIKFSPADKPPEVTISVDELTDQYNFTVRDKGIGIRPEDNGKIFGIFNRLHDRSTYKGAGIGLAVCKRIVENHGGRIWAEPADKQGTKFCFTLRKD